MLPVVVCGHRIAHRQHVLNRSTLQRRAACDFNIPTPIPGRRFAVTLGNIERHRLQCAQALILRVTLSFQLLSIPVGPTDRGDGRSVDVELLMAECHRASSRSIPIPIATQTPISLRQGVDGVVQVVNEPFLGGWRRDENWSAAAQRESGPRVKGGPLARPSGTGSR